MGYRKPIFLPQNAPTIAPCGVPRAKNGPKCAGPRAQSAPHPCYPPYLLRELSPEGGCQQQQQLPSSPGWPGERRNTLIQVVVEVRSGAASFRVSVRAHSIERAISLVRDSYPGAEARLVLPVEPESFFSGDDFDGVQQGTLQRPERLLVG